MPTDLLQRLELDLEGPAQLGVEGAEGLVEQEHRRPEHEGPGQGDPLLLATRQLTGPALLVAGQLDQFEGGADPFGLSPPSQLLVAEPEGHVLGHERKGNSA